MYNGRSRDTSESVLLLKKEEEEMQPLYSTFSHVVIQFTQFIHWTVVRSFKVHETQVSIQERKPPNCRCSQKPVLRNIYATVDLQLIFSFTLDLLNFIVIHVQVSF